MVVGYGTKKDPPLLRAGLAKVEGVYFEKSLRRPRGRPMAMLSNGNNLPEGNRENGFDGRGGHVRIVRTS